MKYLLYIFIILFAKVSLGQTDFQDTTWFDKDWKETTKAQTEYYRVYKVTNKGYLVKDMYLSGLPQMISEASAIKPELIQDGLTTYYNDKNEIASKGNYKNNEKIGDWLIYEYEPIDSIKCNYSSDEIECFRYSNKSSFPMEKMPEYEGGVNALVEFLQKNIKYPKEARKKGWEGKPIIEFIVNVNGNIEKTKISKSAIYTCLDEEALRVVSVMPKWKPGMIYGKPVPVLFKVPINFTLKD